MLRVILIFFQHDLATANIPILLLAFVERVGNSNYSCHKKGLQYITKSLVINILLDFKS